MGCVEIKVEEQYGTAPIRNSTIKEHHQKGTAPLRYRTTKKQHH